MTGAVVAVRPMRDDDIEAVSAVRVNGWKAAYQGLVPAGYLDQLTVAEDARKRREYFAQADGSVENLVAESGGEVVARGTRLGRSTKPGASRPVAGRRTGRCAAIRCRRSAIATNSRAIDNLL
jgi:hypothetical protein